MSVTALFVVVAFLCTVLSAVGKVPVWVGVLWLPVVHLLDVLPR